MQFGNLVLVEKTFTREVNNPRGQNYEGIKFRRILSKKEGKEGQLEETFTFADKLFESLQLSTYALAQANTPDKSAVLLLVVEDQDKVKPVAKFMRQQTKKDGTKPAKGRTFSNEFVTEALVDAKTLDKDTMDNQYLALENVTDMFEDRPEVVKGIFKFIIDESVDIQEEEGEEEEGTEGAETAEQSVEQPQAEQQPATSGGF